MNINKFIDLSKLNEVIYAIDKNGIITYMTDNIEKVSGYSISEVVGRPFIDFLCSEDLEEGLKMFVKILTGKAEVSEYRMQNKNGQIEWVKSSSVLIKDENNNVVGVQGVLSKITDVKLVQEELQKKLDALEKISNNDVLTGFYNRRGFLTLAESHLNLLKRRKIKDSFLCFIDVDDLKYVNDNLGHNEGDNYLKAVSSILKATFRASDIIARLGGDEFVVLMADLNNDKNGRSIEQAKARLKKNIDIFNKNYNLKYKIDMSVGHVSISSDNNKEMKELIEIADKNMYKNKMRKKSKKNKEIV